MTTRLHHLHARRAELQAALEKQLRLRDAIERPLIEARAEQQRADAAVAEAFQTWLAAADPNIPAPGVTPTTTDSAERLRRTEAMIAPALAEQSARCDALARELVEVVASIKLAALEQVVAVHAAPLIAEVQKGIDIATRAMNEFTALHDMIREQANALGVGSMESVPLHRIANGLPRPPDEAGSLFRHQDEIDHHASRYRGLAEALESAPVTNIVEHAAQ
ncbi:MAG TPA: hypothetical protein VGM06_10545 [Polyangiaceae bacterium]|jgi:hypothetical protein